MKRLASIPAATVAVVATLAVVWAGPARAQEPTWNRDRGPTEPRLALFHSTQAVNLPTVETLNGGELLFEIAHRFEPAISEAEDALFGLDGPVFLRLGLAYALTDRVMVGVTRSNLQDNWDLNVKARLAGIRGGLPLMIGVAGGFAYNGELPASAERESQLYGQLILNTMLGERVGLGVVPWVLRDPDLELAEAETALGVGLYGQWYLSDQASVLFEWNATEGYSDYTEDAGTLALELETGGHFFKLMVTNSVRPNPSQFLAGADVPFEPDEWRLGFNITRVLVF
ncbi:MAG: DUF5777 family beta-barrel protein [Longimicrobiales bacterium]